MNKYCITHSKIGEVGIWRIFEEISSNKTLQALLDGVSEYTETEMEYRDVNISKYLVDAQGSPLQVIFKYNCLPTVTSLPDFITELSNFTALIPEIFLKDGNLTEGFSAIKNRLICDTYEREFILGGYLFTYKNSIEMFLIIQEIHKALITEILHKRDAINPREDIRIGFDEVPFTECVKKAKNRAQGLLDELLNIEGDFIGALNKIMSCLEVSSTGATYQNNLKIFNKALLTYLFRD